MVLSSLIFILHKLTVLLVIVVILRDCSYTIPINVNVGMSNTINVFISVGLVLPTIYDSDPNSPNFEIRSIIVRDGPTIQLL